MKKTNTTLAMVAVLAAVAMLSAVLAVPIQEASAEKRNGGSRGGNNVEIEQSNECREAAFSCVNELDLTNEQTISEDGGPPGPDMMD